MAKKRFVLGMLAVALVFGILAVGCETGDEWSLVDNLVELDGTWKATVKSVITGVSTNEAEATLVVYARGAGSFTETVVVKVTYDTAALYESVRDTYVYTPATAVKTVEVTHDAATKTITTKVVTKSASSGIASEFDNDYLSPDGRTLLHNNFVYTKQ
jgi:hypothetical protein